MTLAELERAAPAAIAASGPMTPVRYRITRVRRELSDTFTLDLEPRDAPIADFAPGQFNMLYRYGVGEVPISVSGDPARADCLVHTVRAVGTVTEALRGLGVGDTVGVRGPFGIGWPVEEASGNDVVVVAGGLGLAPLRPAVYRILAERERYGRFVLLYGARTPRDVLFRRELERWRRRLDVQVEVTVDRAPASWRGDVGTVVGLIRRCTFDADHATALVCGPEIMMRFAVQALNQRGLPDSDVHVSLERNMECGIGQCGRCQLGPYLLCRDGPVVRYDRVAAQLRVREL